MKKVMCCLIAGSVWMLCTAAIPIQTETMNQDGRQIISKTFELPLDEDPSQLVEEPFEADGYETSTYTVSDTREYPGLEHNDPALVPQTVTKNGLTLTLSGITWKGLGGTDPTSYTAVVSYKGTGSSKNVTGYTTASYTGDVMASGIQKVRYTVTYLGKEPPPFPWHFVWLGSGILLLLGLVLYLLLRRNVKIYRAFAGQDDYVLVLAP